MSFATLTRNTCGGAADISENRAQDGTFIREFIDFVGREDPSVLPAIEAILAYPSGELHG